MALAVAIGNRIDMDVRGFGNPPPPQCPDKVFVLQVCNSNSLIGDICRAPAGALQISSMFF